MLDRTSKASSGVVETPVSASSTCDDDSQKSLDDITPSYDGSECLSYVCSKVHDIISGVLGIFFDHLPRCLVLL